MLTCIVYTKSHQTNIENVQNITMNVLSRSNCIDIIIADY